MKQMDIKRLMVSAVLGLFAVITQAALLDYEGFDYSGTTALHGQNGGSGWSSAWDDTNGDFAHLTNDDTSLNSDAFTFTPVGVRVEGQGGEARRNLSSVIDMSQDGVIYFSALMRKNSTAASSDEDVLLSLWDGTYQRCVFGLNSDDKFYTWLSNTGEAAEGGTVEAGITYFLVAKVVTSASNNDVIYVKVYAPSDLVTSEPSSWTVVSSGTTGVKPSKLELHIGANVADDGAIDEIRIGETWEDVVDKGTLLAYEGFDYSGTNALDGQSGGRGWDSAWYDSDNDFVHLSDDNTSLDSSAFPFPSIGDRIEGKGGLAYRKMSSVFNMGQDGNVRYFSVLMRKNSTNASSLETGFFQLWSSSEGHVRYQFGLGSSDKFYAFASGGTASESGTVEAGVTYFLVAKMTTSASGSDTINVKVYAPGNTVDTSEPTSWTVSNSGTSGVTLNAIRLSLGANIADDGAFDEIRIGETWASVTEGPPLPQPSGTVIFIQ